MSDPKNYTVGWICAISTEYVAAQAFLDEKHDGPDYVSAADSNDYTLGRMGKHNVVIAVLPDGEYGISSATSVAKDMLHTFTNIRLGLMVGIGGGAPTPKNDIRLGDIVVSSPCNGQSGVFQYDFGKTIQDQAFQTTGFLNQPPAILRTAVHGLRSSYELEGHQLKESIDRVLEKRPRLRRKYTRPDHSHDVLYRPTVQHQNHHESCSNSCGQVVGDLVLRGERTEGADAPVIHYGQIASANQLMKDALLRDHLATEHDVLCFEMEAAGLMNNFPCVIIRGICDYSDSHKNKQWQGFAAMAAAAYAKDLLRRIAPNKIEAEKKIVDILSDLKGDIGELRRAKNNEECETILQWLTPVEYASQQNDNLNRRQPGTGQWYLNSDEFRTWLETPSQTLFCQGMPGAGKTLLSSAIIDRLQNEHQHRINVGIAYIYYNFRRQQDQNPCDILASLLKQFSRGLDPFPRHVRDLFEEHRHNQTRPSVEELSRILQTVVHCFSKTFIVIDALDECCTSGRVRQRVLEHIFALQAATAANLFATSRFSPDIEKLFAGNCTRLEIRASEDDLRKYLDGSLGTLPSFVWRSEELQQKIKVAITRAADGMFLLAQLQLASLVGKRSPKALLSALDQLSTGVDAYANAYNETMDRINAQAPDLKTLAKQALSWITNAIRPLTTTELRHALGVEVGEPKFDEQNLSDIEDIQSACAGLVIVDNESDIIRLVHCTTQQYFEQTQSIWFPSSQKDIANICLTYLTFDVFKDGFHQYRDMYISRLQRYPFYEYAAENWGHHVRVSPDENLQSVRALLQDENALSASCHVLTCSWAFSWENPRQLPPKMTPMHLAAWFGLSAILKELLNTQASPNELNILGLSPLMLAVRGGQEDTVKLLVDRSDVRVNLQDINHRTSVHYAAEYGYTNILHLLMTRSDIEVNPTTRSGMSPLSLAILEGHETIVELLVTHPDIDLTWVASKKPLSPVFDWAAPLYLAVNLNSASIMRLLLTHHSANSREVKHACRELLAIAARMRYLDVVRELLRRYDLGPNEPSARGRTTLTLRDQDDNIEIFDLPLAHPLIALDYQD